MRPWVSTTIIAFAILLCFSLPAYAYQPYTCSYTLKASSPVDDPSTGPVEASPGMAITIEADATGTYSGPISLTLPDFNVNLDYRLKHGGVPIDSKTDSYPVKSMKVDPGKTYSQTGSRTYTLPSNLSPGNYVLECTAEVSVLGIGRTEHASFPIKVSGAPPRSIRAETPTVPGSIASPSPAVIYANASVPTSGSGGPVGESQSNVAKGLAGFSMGPVGILQFVIDSLRQIL